MAVPGVETSDEALAARAAAGDEPAFEALVIRYQARVFRLARRLTGSDGDAQDALQDAFLQVHRTCRRSAARRASRPGSTAS